MTGQNTNNLSDAIRNLIVCDTQFGWTGETTLKLPELLDLQARGWLIEGDENCEFSLTDEGQAVVARALQQDAPAELAEQQGDALIDTALGYLSTALDDLDSCPDRRPGIMVTEAMHTLREAIAARQPGAQEELHGFLKNSTALREAALRALGFIDRSDEHGRTAYDCLRRELHAECAAPPAQGIDLGPLRRLYQAYVRLLESGRDRIIDFGGTCDPVDLMERTDVNLIEPRNLLGIRRDAAPGPRISQGTHDPRGVGNG